MAVEVIMPALGMAQDTGIVVSWLKSEGDRVEQGEPLMEIETDKATVEVEAPATGIVAKILTKEDEEVPVGQVIALIAAPGENIAGGSVEPNVSTEAGAPADVETVEGKHVSVSPVARRLAERHGINLDEIPTRGTRVTKEDVKAFVESQNENSATDRPKVVSSPKARRLMRELGISPAEIAGSGPGGAILTEDVLAIAEKRRVAQIDEKREGPAAIEETAVTPRAAKELPISTVWRIMAERTTESWTNTPHFYLMREVNVSRFVKWRENMLGRNNVKVTLTDLLVKVVAMAIYRSPRMNVAWENGKLLQKNEVDVGLAVATEDGLVVPVVRNANRMGVTEIAAVRMDMVDRARKRRLQPNEIGGGSLTISNLGMYGIDIFSAIINSPEPAILAVGRIKDKVVAINGKVVINPMMAMTLSCDHRAIDGALGALFLKTIAEIIEEPLNILD